MAQIDDLPPLREVIRRHGLSAKKTLGQNFLLDLNLTARIARAAEPLDGATVIEVGPGPGGLTRALLALGASRVIAIERDQRAVAALEEIAARYPDRLEIVAGDALEFDYSAHLGGTRAKIIANLPYNIATALLINWLTVEPWPPWYDRLVLMFQREVAERIVAAPGSKSYGRLSILAGWRTQPKILFDIHPSAFVPPPKVTSSVVEFVPRATPLACDRRMLERVTEAAFGQRRKMLRQSLKTLGTDPLPLLAEAGIEPTARAEDIPVEGFVALANALNDPHFARFDSSWVGTALPLLQAGTLATMAFELIAPLYLVWLYYAETADRPGRLRALCNRLRLRWLWIGLGVAFHIGIAVFLRIGVFPWAMLAMYPVLLRPAEVSRLGQRLRRMLVPANRASSPS